MNATPVRSFAVKWAFLIAGFVACSTFAVSDDSPPVPPKGPWVWSGDPAGLQSLSFCQLDDLFRRASIHEVPVGRFRGQIIGFTHVPVPNLAKKIADRVWVGKQVEPNGNFINQWKHRNGRTSQVAVGPSFTDGKPAILFEYPRLTPVFGATRDECREIAQGLYLVKMYRRVPYVRFLGFSYLRLNESGCAVSDVLTPEEQIGSLK